MTRSYIKIYLDVDNPNGDEIAFQTKDQKKMKSIISYLKTHCEAVVPE